MEIAIIGAGVAGLSCAYEFKRNGIVPTIFEQKDYLAQAVDFNTCTLRLFDRNIGDPISYLKKEYGLDLKSLTPLREIVMISPNKQNVVRGKLGYVFNRGENRYSLESQIASSAGVPIIFSRNIEYENVKNDFDYVVVATGKSDTANRLNAWTPTFNAFARIATVSGDFKTDSLTMWVDTRFAKQCFVFQMASSPKKACIVVSANDISHSDLDYYWEEFLKSENITDRIIKTSDVEHNLGFAKPARVGNTYFIGKAGGFIDSVLGFGMLNGIESGIFAARSILNKKSFEKITRPIVRDLKSKNEFRKAINKFNNEDYDKVIEFLGLPLVKQLVYKNPLAKVSHVTFIAKMYNVLKFNENKN